jgi:Zn-dependent protease
MQGINVVFYIAILLMSVVIHEISHGFVAEYFGDKTARNAGRLTLNPIKHLDFFGSILLPALMYFSFGFAFGWAKPVPYNPDNLSNKRLGTIAVASAGILANLFIAVLFGTILRFTLGLDLPTGFYFMTSTIVVVNLALAIFNLIPIPPIDGSKILFQILPKNLYKVEQLLEQYGLIFLFIFIFFFSDYLYPVLAYLYHLVTGLSL